MINLKTELKKIWWRVASLVGRPKQTGALLRGDMQTYLIENSHAMAEQENERPGRDRKIGKREVDAILNTPDRFYLGNMTPLQFVANYPESYHRAVIAVRETIRERNGSSLGRVPVSQLRGEYNAGGYHPFGKG